MLPVSSLSLMFISVSEPLSGRKPPCLYPSAFRSWINFMTVFVIVTARRASRSFWPLLMVRCDFGCPAALRDIWGCQWSTPVPKYQFSLHMPLTSLFSSFSIYLSGPFPPRPDKVRNLIIFLDFLTFCPIGLFMNTSTSDLTAGIFNRRRLSFCITLDDSLQRIRLRHLHPCLPAHCATWVSGEDRTIVFPYV